MKNQWRLWGMIPLVLLGLAACNKDDAASQDQGKGNVKITFGFEQKTDTKGPATAAIAPSSKKPATSCNNVKDLVILFVKEGGIIEDARRIEGIPVAEDMSTFEPEKLKNILAGTYKVVIIANSGQSGVSRPWTPENAKGKALSSLLMNLVSETLPQELSGTGHKEPAEIFYASQENITIEADKDNIITTPFKLQRTVSLIRVRLAPVGDNLTKIDFTGDGKGALFFRKVQTTMTAANTFAGRSDAEGIYIGKSFSTNEPNGYAGEGNIIAGEVTCFQEFLSFPGGSKTVGAEKFDIMIMGTVKESGYRPAGAQADAAVGDQIYWSGPINEVADANGILEVVITVKTVGEPDAPEPGSYGNLDIKVTLSDWGNVSQYVMEV